MVVVGCKPMASSLAFLSIVTVMQVLLVPFLFECCSASLNAMKDLPVPVGWIMAAFPVSFIRVRAAL